MDYGHLVPRTTRIQYKYKVRIVLGTSCPDPYVTGGGQTVWYSAYNGQNQALPNMQGFVSMTPLIDLFHNNFSPSGLQPEHRKLAHGL